MANYSQLTDEEDRTLRVVYIQEVFLILSSVKQRLQYYCRKKLSSMRSFINNKRHTTGHNDDEEPLIDSLEHHFG